MGLLDLIFGPRAQRADAVQADPIIERLMRATDRRLGSVPGYREKLRGPVLEARERVREMIARIPGPIEVSAQAWSADTTVRALFARATDVSPAFSSDGGVRAFFDANPGCDCYGMLALEQQERRVLTTALHGDSLQAEVARTTLSFSRPLILAPAAGEAAVREELALRALEYLALRALETVGAARAERRELEKERALLNAQLRLAERRGAGFGAMAGGTSRAQVERDLEETVRELERSASQNLVPPLLEELTAALAAPASYLSIEPATFALDSMNFVVEPGPQSVTPRVAVLGLARRGPFGVLIAHFPRSEFKVVDRLAEAEKFL